jgi:hypothetical protein
MYTKFLTTGNACSDEQIFELLKEERDSDTEAGSSIDKRRTVINPNSENTIPNICLLDSQTLTLTEKIGHNIYSV